VLGSPMEENQPRTKLEIPRSTHTSEIQSDNTVQPHPLLFTIGYRKDHERASFSSAMKEEELSLHALPHLHLALTKSERRVTPAARGSPVDDPIMN
jgi:hypothetical protein